MDALKPQRNEPARMEKLAKLPVFWGLEGKRVVLAGGSDGAAWKAELLAACGADVHVYCQGTGLSQTFAALIAATPALTLHDCHWHSGIFENAELALADCETDEEAADFYHAARTAGVPVNVIDKPEFCQFQFGSIVNRSPVVVSISTDGAAPILAQAIRRRIETLLPHTLKQWGALAHAIRERVNIRLSPGNVRRSFWEKFVDHAFTESPDGDVEARLLGDIEHQAHSVRPQHGQVTLVGAGPGDAELLTLKAVRALQAADVIMFDDLVSDDVLELARREAKRMLVGKRGGRESCKQEDINETMIRLAKAGKRVVRLKSGDPMIFGRAGEEIAALRAENINVEVVPGITGASAMASRLGLSLTHRDHAQSVRFITGHSRQGKLPSNIDWKSLSDPSVTTVFYMGGRTAAGIQSSLLAHGMPASTPVAIMTSVSRQNEKRWQGILEQLPEAVEELGVNEPILIGIGDAFGAKAAVPVDLGQPIYHRSASTMRR
ncbi:siroheme synthase CysG [Agrobacterium tumefaciens]|uniref:siroheme synthase CysG n=1 Tax=Agrobacterium tumefaciens TaxID=358 RepID=UPI00287F398D|nr:siroheme synthase CysG [Agrobacterium tumefaciens]MDS7595001.1 siroheme synthase CysG [Agrobacterium tumefaciens]